jgi:hypothetical protein
MKMTAWMKPFRPRRAWGMCICMCANIEEAVGFYHGVIGFDVMGVAKPSAWRSSRRAVITTTWV